jgi:hypothetical protein
MGAFLFPSPFFLLLVFPPLLHSVICPDFLTCSSTNAVSLLTTVALVRCTRKSLAPQKSVAQKKRDISPSLSPAGSSFLDVVNGDSISAQAPARRRPREV